MNKETMFTVRQKVELRANFVVCEGQRISGNEVL